MADVAMPTSRFSSGRFVGYNGEESRTEYHLVTDNLGTTWGHPISYHLSYHVV